MCCATPVSCGEAHTCFLSRMSPRPESDNRRLSHQAAPHGQPRLTEGGTFGGRYHGRRLGLRRPQSGAKILRAVLRGSHIILSKAAIERSTAHAQ